MDTAEYATDFQASYWLYFLRYGIKTSYLTDLKMSFSAVFCRERSFQHSPKNLVSSRSNVTACTERVKIELLQAVLYNFFAFQPYDLIFSSFALAAFYVY